MTTINPTPRLYTYQDLSGMFHVHQKTIYRWFRRRKKFNPSHSTVRITEAQLEKFMKDCNKEPRKS